MRWSRRRILVSPILLGRDPTGLWEFVLFPLFAALFPLELYWIYVIQIHCIEVYFATYLVVYPVAGSRERETQKDRIGWSTLWARGLSLKLGCCISKSVYQNSSHLSVVHADYHSSENLGTVEISSTLCSPISHLLKETLSVSLHQNDDSLVMAFSISKSSLVSFLVG